MPFFQLHIKVKSFSCFQTYLHEAGCLSSQRAYPSYAAHKLTYCKVLWFKHAYQFVIDQSLLDVSRTPDSCVMQNFFNFTSLAMTSFILRYITKTVIGNKRDMFVPHTSRLIQEQSPIFQ